MYDPMDTEILSLPIDTGVTIEDYAGKKKFHIWILCIVRKKEKAYLIVQLGYIKT